MDAVRRLGWCRAPAIVAAVVMLLAGPRVALPCDICAIYSATALRDEQRGFEIGVGQQFSDFATLQDGSDTVSDPADEYLLSSITQVLFAYNVNRRLGFQLNLPIIVRDFRRLEQGVVRRGDETGVGDLSLLGVFRPFTHVTTKSVVRFSLFGGLKLPSGDSDRLEEELEEDEEDAAEVRMIRRHGGAAATRSRVAGHLGDGEDESGIHGHDLALGSGSVDGIVGGGVFASWRRWFLTAHVQYAIRTEGDFDYQYANDLMWATGPGAFLLLHARYTLGVQGVVSGETKGKDEFRGRQVGDTGVTALYVGPRVLFTWGTSLYADVAGELPVIQHNTGLQIMPDYRIRGGATWRF